MTKPGIETAGLRIRAEAVLAGRSWANGGDEGQLRRTLHELQVHQVELEIQQEELLQANRSLTLLRDEYRDLFDFAPIGYFKLPKGGGAMTMNLTLQTLLHLPVDARAGALAPYIDDIDRPAWDGCLKRLRLGEHRCDCTLKLQVAGHASHYVKVFLAQFDTLHGGGILGAVVPIDEAEYFRHASSR